MKIGIITQPLHNNYGGLLQNYALQQTLLKMGHTPITLDQVRYSLTSIFCIRSSIKACLWNLLHRKYRMSEYKFRKLNSIVSPNTQYFIDKYIKRTKRVWGCRETRKLAESLKIDAYIVGSDQVWRPRFRGRLMVNFLDFTRGWNVIRIAYAASFGVDEWKLDAKQTEEAQNLVKEFNAVSVRESSGINLCAKYLNVKATHVLDPTMLLDAEDYLDVVRKENIERSQGNMFCYILDPTKEKTNMIERYEKCLGLKPFELMPQDRISRYRKPTKSVFDFAHVHSWIQAFYDSEYVICDSFHGVVFSIIFNKPFTVIQNNGRGNARFDSLLEIFNLKSRLVSPADTRILSNDIDWHKVNNIREEWKSKSLNFLTHSLVLDK